MSKSVIIDNLVNDKLYGFRIFPRNLKGQYQTETDGATATATPKAIDPIFGNNTWEVINLASTSGNIPPTWQVGDTKDITLTTGETLTMQIYGFNHDDLASGGKAGITLGTKNLVSNLQSFSTRDSGIDWGTSSIRSFLNDGSLFSSIPLNIRNIIKQVTKTYNLYYSSNTKTSVDKVFLFSVNEIDEYYSAQLGGTIYDIYKNIPSSGVRIKKLSNGNGNSAEWLLRSMHINMIERVMSVNATNGNLTHKLPTNPAGVCFGFCI